MVDDWGEEGGGAEATRDPVRGFVEDGQAPWSPGECRGGAGGDRAGAGGAGVFSAAFQNSDPLDAADPVGYPQRTGKPASAFLAGEDFRLGMVGQGMASGGGSSGRNGGIGAGGSAVWVDPLDDHGNRRRRLDGKCLDRAAAVTRRRVEGTGGRRGAGRRSVG